MNYFAHDTIIAVATSLAGDGGVGIVRLSGPKSVELAQKYCRGFENPKSRYMHRIDLLDASGAVVDDGLGVYFPEGQSFTGEPVVELQVHGGRFLLQQIVKQFVATGKCRMALPGEFSFRAVRNGKMSLNDAQAVRQLVNARSQYEVWSARQNLSGDRQKEFQALAARIRHLLAMSELSIDFIDQDVEVISAAQLLAELHAIESAIKDLNVRIDLARRIAHGPLVVFAGEPNAGKSTLFNSVLAEDRAIVSDEEGTTRDVITEELLLGPYRLRIADTAGLRETVNLIEKEGIQRSESMLEKADVAVLLADGEKLTQGVLPPVSALKAANLIVVNKTDLLSAEQIKQIEVKISAPGVKVCFVSAKTGKGIAEFLTTLRGVLDGRFGLGLSTPLPTEFQVQMLNESLAKVQDTIALVTSRGLENPELISAALLAAVKALTDIAGETTPDTILNQIFADFCIGK